jgi:nicotinate-nucleotide adenylyltransferase
MRGAAVRASAQPVITTGLLGGSFNPAHRGHRRISMHALQALGLDEMWWLVSPGNPLKPAKGMAPLPVRYRSAVRAARGYPIRPTAIERQLGSPYTYDTLLALTGRYPKRRFIWIMGSDNLLQFHRWREWRKIARLVPIAVVARPGYDGDARAARAMGWLRRFVRPASHARDWTRWRPPALVFLQLPLDPTSATGIRAACPNWHQSPHLSFNPKALRDGVTRRPVR